MGAQLQFCPLVWWFCAVLAKGSVFMDGHVYICAKPSIGCTTITEYSSATLPRLHWGSLPSLDRLALLGRKRNLEDKEPADRPAS